jgi:hypothetical protein
VVATGGKRWQIAQPLKRRNHAKTVAVGCDRLPLAAHGKEGVSGSSPEEGSAKAPHVATFFVRADLIKSERALGMEQLMEPSAEKRSFRDESSRPRGPCGAP